MVGLMIFASGRITATVGTACSSVHSFSFSPDCSRARMPVTTTTTSAMPASTPKMPSFRRDSAGVRSVGIRHLRCRGGFGALFLVYHTENDRNKHERRDRREDQAADHGAAKRRILFTALAQPQRHR